MKLSNAVKKIEKLGKVIICGQQYSVQVGNQVLSFMANGRIDENTNICAVNLRWISDESDVYSDYCAGTFYPNISQAIKSMTRKSA